MNELLAKVPRPTSTATGTRIYALTFALLLALLSIAALALNVQPASAATEQVTFGSSAWAKFVKFNAPPFWCGPGYIGQAYTTITAPSNYGNLFVIDIFTPKLWAPSNPKSVNGWYSYQSIAPHPSGFDLTPGQNVTEYKTVPAVPGYWQISETIQWFQNYGNYLKVGEVDLSPTLAGDYSSGGIQGPGYSYCHI
jgi:hypothetical protein